MAEERVQRMRSVVGWVLGALRRAVFVAIFIALSIFLQFQLSPRTDIATNPAADFDGLTIAVAQAGVYPLAVTATGPGRHTISVLTVTVNEPPPRLPTLSVDHAEGLFGEPIPLNIATDGRSVTRDVPKGVMLSAGIGAVVLRPGDDIQAAVDAAPEGQAFVLDCGVYREQTVRPKNGQSFDGQGCATLNGARVMTGWRRDGGHWRLGGLPSARRGHGGCSGGGTLCHAREDMFVDGVLYGRVGSLAGLAPGRLYRDGNTIFIIDDPTGKIVELALTAFAFKGKTTAVVLKDLTVTRYANDAQRGVIQAKRGLNWVIENVTSRWNHGAGLSAGPGFQIIGGLYADNGQIGIKADGAGILLDGVEIARNNYAGFKSGWEAGGTKFWNTNGLIVRNSCVHDNNGTGLWTDHNNVNTLYENNVVFRNAKHGIQHEISFSAIIRHNTLVDNGSPKKGWLWSAGIVVQNSSNVDVYENFVQVTADHGNGITIVNQNRKDWVAIDNNVHDNVTVFLGDANSVKRHHGGIVGGGTGMADQRNTVGFQERNRWEDNEYVIAPNREHRKLFKRPGGWATWAWIQANTQMERRGVLTLERREPVEIGCP